MKQARETDKRIVSKGAYVRRHLFRVSGKSAGIVVQIGAIIWFVIVPLLSGQEFDVFHHDTDSFLYFVAIWLMATIVGLSGMMFREVGIKVVQQSNKIDVGVPLTRANTANLPAPDSLVRASQKPVQAQEAVLLRAAGRETQEGQEEQLLRASARGPELKINKSQLVYGQHDNSVLP